MQNIFKYSYHIQYNKIIIYNGLIERDEELLHEFINYPSCHKIWFPKETILSNKHLVELILNKKQIEDLNKFLIECNNINY
jgi:hypothetical protein